MSVLASPNVDILFVEHRISGVMRLRREAV